MIINQQSFLGGISARYNELRADPNTYQLLVNGRVRDNSVEAILSPLQDTLAPAGLYQNLTAIGSVLLLFVSGACWYRDLEGIYGWRKVSGMTLDPDVDTIDTEDIPSSTLNFKRTGPIDNVKFNNSPARQTAEGVLACDGITQPSLIYPELGGVISARTTYTYAQWTETTLGTEREYVPVGRYPKYIGQKLYMAIKGPAGRLNKIAHSVSGRPLDFVIAINDTTGDKDGDALLTAHAIGFDDVSGIFKSGDDDALIVTTGRNTVGVKPDHSDLSFFYEPRLRNRSLFPSGVLNPNCAVDLNGDSAFISQTGIHSYNSVLQQRNESNNDPVSAQVYRLLARNQTYGAAIDFDDYAFFALETIYGPGVVIFDKTLVSPGEGGKFISLDLYRNIGQIKQFAKISTSSGQRLFFITQDNRLFEFGAGAEYEICRLYLGDWNGAVAGVSQIFRRASLVFSDVYENATVQISEFADRQNTNTAAYHLQGATVTSAPTFPVPYHRTRGASNGLVHHESTVATLGFSVGLLVEWASAAKLVFARLDLDFESKVPLTQTTYYAGVNGQPDEFLLAGDFAQGIIDQLWLRSPAQLIGVGNIGTWTAYSHTLAAAKSRFFPVAGNVDLDPDGGLIFYNRVANGARYYSVVRGNAEFFFYNVGWTTANIGTGTGDPDGFTLGSTQALWLKGAMAQSTAKFKIVVIHFPPYSSSSAGFPTLRLPFRPWGATLVVSAHDKNYQRHIIDGLNYITVGTGSTSSDALAAPISGYQNGRAGTAGYLQLRTTEFNITTAHIGVDGTVFDEFVIYP